jgi:outer membrane protein assembly factor BamD
MPRLLPIHRQKHCAAAPLGLGRRHALAAALMVAAALTACGPETAQPVSAEAQQLYVDAMEHLHGGSLIEAEQEFQKLAKLPSYVQLTSLARLRLADTLFQARRYDEAIEAYHSFIQRHEGNDNVPYATFMIAKANFELAPTDLWIMPPVHELDLSPVQQARTELERFIRTYPRSRFATEALALRDRCIELQFAHTSYVIDFYAQRKQWIGVVFRLHRALQAYPTRAHTPANYRLLADAYAELHWRSRAVELWQAMAQRWPKGTEAAEAPAKIRSLQQQIEEATARGEPGAMPAEVPPTAQIKPEKVGDAEDA